MILNSDRSTPLPLIALVGRPNVGKSSLFNRLTHSRAALVDDTPGLTRDRQYGVAHGRGPVGQDAAEPVKGKGGLRGRNRQEAQGVGRPFRVVDTGGFEPETSEPVTSAMREQTLVAIEEADVILFITDAQSGPLADDWAITDLLRRSGKPLICVVNKAEGRVGSDGVLAFYQLGLHPLCPVSATHGIGMALLVDTVFERLAAEGAGVQPTDVAPEAVWVAVVGCPNAGKSTLINRLVGEARLVVSDVPGTTRDTIDLPVTDEEGRAFVLVDTAGIRKKSRISLRIEKYAALAAIRAMDRAQVAVLLLDASRGITDQDRRVANLAVDAGCGLVLAVNKWDAMAVGDATARRLFQEEMNLAFPQSSHAPAVFLSAKTGRGVSQILSTVFRVWEAGNQRVPTGALNRWLVDATTQHAPPRTGGRVVKLRYATQVSINPPTFILFTNRPVVIHETYRRYLENRLRVQFGFAGAALRVVFRSGGGENNPYAPPEGKVSDRRRFEKKERVARTKKKRATCTLNKKATCTPKKKAP